MMARLASDSSATRRTAVAGRNCRGMTGCRQAVVSASVPARMVLSWDGDISAWTLGADSELANYSSPPTSRRGAHVSVASQRSQRVDADRAVGWNEGRDRCSANDARSRDDETHRVEGSHAIEQRPHCPRRTRRAEHSYPGTDEYRPQTVAEHEAQYARRSRAEGHPDSDLLRARCDEESDDAEHPDA